MNVPSGRGRADTPPAVSAAPSAAPPLLRLFARLDTLALRLFGLMCGALVLSHVVAFTVVHLTYGRSVHAPAPAPPLQPAPMAPPRIDDGPGARPARPGPEAGPPPVPAPAGLGGSLPHGEPPAPGPGPRLPPTLGSLPPTPGLPGTAAAAAGRAPATPPLPTRVLVLDYGVRLLVIALAAWWGARWLARPMARLTTAARALGNALAQGRRTSPLDERRGTHEVRAAAGVFNGMAAQIHGLVEGRSLMMAAISHDLRTPLTRMRMRLETTEVPSLLRERCVADIGEMNALVDAALDMFRAGVARSTRRTDVGALVQALVDDHAEQGQPVRLVAPGPARLVVHTDALALRRIVDNLVVNALRYAGAAEVQVAAGEAGGARIIVADRGPGIPTAQLAEMLQPFARGEASRHRASGGAGLGLAIANELAHALGGTLALAHRAGGGLEAVIELPAGAG